MENTIGKEALREAMYRVGITNNPVTRFAADAIAEKVVREEKCDVLAQLTLPNGQVLKVKDMGNPDYPGLWIYLASPHKGKEEKEKEVCFTEYSSSRGKVCAGIYDAHCDEPVTYIEFEQKHDFSHED